MIAVLVFAAALLASEASDVKLWPMPQQFQPDGTALSFDPQRFNVMTDCNSPLLHRGIQRFKRDLLPPAPATVNGHINDPDVRELEIVVQSANESLAFGVDENYNLTVQAPRATLHAASVFGALYGLESFSQLINANGQEWSPPYGVCWKGNYTIAGCTMRDWPRFRWRGLLLETGSHFYPIQLLERMIDAMAANKLNALHWSLYDVNSFPFQSSSLPKLSSVAYSPEATYSHADIRGLQVYAKDRGVRLVPNWPQPAHVQAVCEALHICSGVGGTGGLLDPTNPATLPTFQKLFEESATVFEDEYIHIYDDEAHYLYDEWNKSAQVQQFMKNLSIATFPELETWFEKRIVKLAEDTGKKPIVWESHTNFLAASGPRNDSPHWMRSTFDPAKVVATAYIYRGSLPFLLNKGYHTLFASDRWYLDYDSGSQLTTPWAYYKVDPIITDNASDPLYINSTAEQRILGGQASMWAENTDAKNLESRVWPTASAVAEKLWSPRNLTDIDLSKVPFPLRLRFSAQACRMQQRGVNSGPYLQSYCCTRDAGLNVESYLV